MGGHHLLGPKKSKALDKHREFDEDDEEEQEKEKQDDNNERDDDTDRHRRRRRGELAPRSSPLVAPTIPKLARSITDSPAVLQRRRPRRRSFDGNSHPSSASSPSTDFAQPNRVPMPLMRPRETDTQLGERDEQLENGTSCGEDGMHDCFVQHEKERVRERRAEKAALPSGSLALAPHSVQQENDEGERVTRLFRRRR